MKYLGLIAALLLVGAGCTTKSSTVVEPTVAPRAQQDNSLELKQERMMTYRKECQEEWQAKLDFVDETVKDAPGITPQQAQNLARNAGITDENNYVIDADVWVKGCMDKKAAIFE